MKFEFTDKSSYLAWRAQWRADYKALSQDIRALKRTRKQFLNHYHRVITPLGPVKELVSREPNPFYKELASLNLSSLQSHATYQLELLVEAKALSWSLKLGAAAAKSAAA